MATKKKSTAVGKKAEAKGKTKTAGAIKSKTASAKKAAAKTSTKKKASVAKKTAATVKTQAAKKNKDEKRTKTATVKKETNVEKKAATDKKMKAAASPKTAVSKEKKDTSAKNSAKSSGNAKANGVDKSKAAGTKGKSASSKSNAAKKDNSKPKFVYKPEPSILDIPQENHPRKRYSDNELQEFKVLIQGKLEAAHKELVYLQGLITRKDEAGTDDTENKYMGVEDGGGTMEREQLSQLASRQIQFIDKLEKALQRIENKTYGICRETGKLIDKARLRAVPHATLSIEAKLAKKR